MSSLTLVFATCVFALAVTHTFITPVFQRLAKRHPEGSAAENFWHLLGEVETVFGLWAGLLLLGLWALEGGIATLDYLQNRSFTEPLFVFVIMALASTRPLLQLAESTLLAIARRCPLPFSLALYFSLLSLGPLLGSLLTEPAAMTVTGLLVHHFFFRERPPSRKFLYGTFAVLLVNVSIGGALTPYAAPPILMVAKAWGWDLSQMWFNFGWKIVPAVLINAGLATVVHRRELRALPLSAHSAKREGLAAPFWLCLIHVLFLAAIIFSAHHPVVFMGIFLYFLGFFRVTEEHQSPLQLRSSLLVAFFLAGLVVIGGLQNWWLQPALQKFEPFGLFLAAIGLTAVTDNAALTYLGSQVSGLSDLARYALAAGALCGGGLTLIANAPNLVGYALWENHFANGLDARRLFAWSLLPTVIAATLLWGL